MPRTAYVAVAVLTVLVSYVDYDAARLVERTVELEYDEECTDRFDRLLAFVKVDGRMVNEVIVERGFGQVLVIPPNVKYQSEFEMLEARAKDNRAGIWGACQ